VDAEDVGEGPRAKGVDESNVGVDTKMSVKPLMSKFWRCRHRSIDEDIFSMLTSEKPSSCWHQRLVIAVTEDDGEAHRVEVLMWVSHCSH
jgi:hypothetical protein